MANILFLIHKKRFDFLLYQYLKNFHHVRLMTSDPMSGLFLKKQGEDVIDLFRIKPDKIDAPLSSLPKDALRETGLYNATSDSGIKKALERQAVVYLKFMKHFIKRNRIDLVLTQEKIFLDVACITEIAKAENVPVCYLGAGFFRGKTASVCLERLELTNTEIWAKRRALQEKRPVIPSINIAEVPFSPKPLKNPGGMASVWQKIKYQRNPFWVSKHPDLRPPRKLLEDFQHKAAKKRIRKSAGNSNIQIPEAFVLLTLQGNEICSQVPNFLGIQNMEHLTYLVKSALNELNKEINQPLHLIAKEHPNRPGVISPLFKEKHSEIIFLNRYPIEPLLENAKLVVTFNSLSGFEAILKYKPVVTFGPIFYAQPDLVYPAVSLNDLSNVMKRAIMSGCDKAAVDHFSSFLKQYYDIECPGFSRKKPAVEVFKRIASRIEGILEFAKTSPAHPGVWTPLDFVLK